MFKNIFNTIARSKPITFAGVFVKAHKAMSGVILLAVLGGGYGVYAALTSDEGEVSYVTAMVTRGTITVTVTGSGQVSASNQVDLKPKSAGDVVYVGVKNGQTVRAGTLVARLDTYDAANAVRDAEIALDQAKLELEKMKGLSTSEGAIRGAKEKASDDLAKAYEDGFNVVSNAFLDLPGVMTGLQDMEYGNLFSQNQPNLDYYMNGVETAAKSWNAQARSFRDDADRSYRAARAAYDLNLTRYKSVSRFSDVTVIESLIEETYETTKLVAEALKNMNNLIVFYKDQLSLYNTKPVSGTDTHLASLAGYTSKTNSYLSNLLSIRDTIQNNKETLITADFDMADQKILVEKAARNLEDAKQALAERYVYAPFAGVIAAVDVERGDAVSAGTAVATLITNQRIAEITLNEVDAAKVEAGQAATLTFDALSDLETKGEVTEVDTLGEVSQGVVSYGITLAFSADDARIKPGMSVAVSIITNRKENVLLVPGGAVKSQNGASYVEVIGSVNIPRAAAAVTTTARMRRETSESGDGFPAGREGVSSGTPRTVISSGASLSAAEAGEARRMPVVIGLANDTMTEIISGLEEGAIVVVRTVTNGTSATAKTAAAPSFFGGGPVGTVRVMR
ncbi:MAG: efflux RND transporter periplasmic adaptor subunit [Candidatus Brennerbacteria bacterium]|nr:efflux RND transporter periplasmic adaptor subunit [Candidatus Brennerbacteria bacterium]